MDDKAVYTLYTSTWVILMALPLATLRHDEHEIRDDGRTRLAETLSNSLSDWRGGAPKNGRAPLRLTFNKTNGKRRKGSATASNII